MPKGMLGKKVGMTQFFDENGLRVGVTVIEVPDNRILQVKTDESDGYNALQLGAFNKKKQRCTKAELGHAKTDGESCSYVKEIRTEDIPAEEAGNSLKMAEVFEGIDKVKISGTTKGKGFAGVLKRHHFGGFRKTHGVKTHHRHPGSIGQCAYPGKVFKGKKMCGQMGNTKVTTKGLKIVKLLPEKQVMLIKGAVPGANGCYVTITEDLGYNAPNKK
ncbi:MAG: 50S ribosomal protein L3 [Planctomycetes bacterium]|nr:50S ribosomal protein L3 [Planctomycetota bacterium]